MKILFLTHTFPYPLNDGVRLHVFYILKELAKNHEISLIGLNDVPVKDADRKALRDINVNVVSVLEHKVPQSFVRRLINTAFDPVPFFVRQFQSDALRAELKAFLASNKVDVVHVDYLSMALYRDEFENLPAVFFPHDSVSMMFERNVSSETDFFRKVYMYFQWRKVRNFEKEWFPKFEGTMVVSPVDRDYLEKHCGNVEIAVSPNGVDTDLFAPLEGREEKNAILFRGVMNFLPNSDAARFFYLDVFPLVKKEVPDAKFYVVGKYPPPDLEALAAKDPSLVLTGYVEDMREAMAKAAVVVCPMRIGSGIKNKILESMSMAKAQVCTSMSCAGLETADGNGLLVADEPRAFAGKVVELLKDRARRASLGKQAREFVMKHYTWKKNADDFETLYVQAIERFKKRHG